MVNALLARLNLSLMPFMAWVRVLNPEIIRTDIVAGIVAGVLIVPQAVALATIAGMPPEYGLYTSIFPVVIAAFFGSSWQALSGPNTALVIMISMAIAPYASIGTADYIMYAVTLSFMVGAFQLAFAILGLGGIFNYFSQTVMVALVTGVGMLIILQQVGNFMGILMNVVEDVDFTVYQMAHNVYLANPFAVLVGVATLACGILVKKYFSKWPHHIVAIVFGTVFAALLDGIFGAGNTNIDRLGRMSLELLPLSAPDFSPTNFAEAAEGLISASFLIATMGLIQSTVIARSMASKTGQHVSFNQEVAGQGLSNIVGSFFSCFPSCGSFNRSAANQEAGARTPLAALVSALVLIVLIFSAGELLAYMPISVMAAILFMVGANLIKWADIKLLLNMDSESRYIFILTLGTTLYGGLQNGVFLGAFLSIVAYLRRVSMPDIEVLFDEYAEPYLPQKTESNNDNVTVLKLSGSLFFGSVHALEVMFSDLAKREQGRGQILVLAADFMHNIDRSGLDALDEEAKKRQQAGGKLQLWLSSPKVHAEFADDSLFKHIQPQDIFYQSAREQLANTNTKHQKNSQTHI